MWSFYRTITTPLQLTRWHLHESPEALRLNVVRDILQAAEQAIRTRGAFHLVLAGGSTPRQIYGALRDAGADWAHWYIYYGDERCLPADHAERNSHMASEAWLGHVPIPPGQVHAIPAELGPEAAAREYALTLESLGDFDLILLGLGEDGHTASLFPGHDCGDAPDAPAALAVFDAPKPPPERVSLSARRLSRTRQAYFLVTGQSKQAAIANWRDGLDIPAARITPDSGVDIHCADVAIAGYSP